MKIINAKVAELVQQSGIEGIYKQIERGGRICYKSEDKITEDSAKRFVDGLIKRGHLAPLEHGTIYLKAPIDGYSLGDFIGSLRTNKYTKCNKVGEFYYITTNMRVLVERDWLETLTFICEPTQYHEKRKSFIVTCDRAIANELVRHRVMSFNQESTRYVNYSHDKWEHEITFIKPCFWDKDDTRYYTWKNACMAAERYYMELLQDGATPQEARSVLPCSTKTELLITGFESDWEGLLKLRCDKAAHPQAQEVANMLKGLLHKGE